MVGVEDIGGHILKFAAVESLQYVEEDVGAVLEGPNDFDISDRVASHELGEGLDETLRASDTLSIYGRPDRH